MKQRYFPSIFDEIDRITALAADCGDRSCTTHGLQGASLSEDPKHLYVDIDLPGVKREEIDISIDQEKRLLSVRAEKKRQRENVNYHIKSRDRYAYDIPLSNEIDLKSKIDATCRDGVLSITLSKNKESTPLKIDVAVE